MVELVVVRGDIGRQNTIFKFYLQSWFLWRSVLEQPWPGPFPPTSNGFQAGGPFWQTAMILLLASAALFTVTGISGKIHDRWIVEAPRTLDCDDLHEFRPV